MDDVILVTGVLVLRPSGVGGDEGITCDGVIEFRPPAGQKKEHVPGTSEIVTSSEEDETIAENGSTE